MGQKVEAKLSQETLPSRVRPQASSVGDTLSLILTLRNTQGADPMSHPLTGTIHILIVEAASPAGGVPVLPEGVGVSSW